MAVAAEEIQQREYEAKLNGMLDSMLREAASARRFYERDWERNLRYIQGDQWFEVNRSQNACDVVDNVLLRAVQQFQAMLTDSRPIWDIEVSGAGKHAQRRKRFFRELLRRYWRLLSLDRVLAETIVDMFVTGKGYWKVYWEPFASWGRGGVEVRRVHPADLFIDPSATTLDNAEFICYRTPITIWELSRRFPKELVDQVKPDDTLSQYASTTSALTPGLLNWPRSLRRTSGEPTAVPRVWYEEWLIRDPTLNEDGTLKYSTARLVCRAGKVILIDSNYPYWDEWPGWWVEFKANHIGTDVYGYPELSTLLPLQDALNVASAILVDNVRFLTTGMWLMDVTALPPGQERSLKPDVGRIVRKRQGTVLERDYKPVPQGILESVAHLRNAIVGNSGLSDVVAGRPPRSVTAATAIEALTAGTNQYVRVKAREIEVAMARAARCLISRFLQFASVADLAELAYDIASTEELQAYEQEGNVNILVQALGLRDWDLETRKQVARTSIINVRPGSMLSSYWKDYMAMVAAMYDKGWVDREWVLEELDIPGRDEVVRRSGQQAMLGGPAVAARTGPAPRGRASQITKALMGRK
jgi:hypothetical protein